MATTLQRPVALCAFLTVNEVNFTSTLARKRVGKRHKIVEKKVYGKAE